MSVARKVLDHKVFRYYGRNLWINSDTAYFMLAAAITGISGLSVPSTQSIAITTALDPLAQIIWLSGLTVGGLVGLVGVIIGNRVGAIIERPARWTLAFMCGAFAVAVLYSVGLRGITGISFIGLYGISCVSRALAIRFDAKHWNRMEARLRAELSEVRADLEVLRADMPSNVAKASDTGIGLPLRQPQHSRREGV